MQRYIDVALMLGSIGLYSTWAGVDQRRRDRQERARAIRVVKDAQ